MAGGELYQNFEIFQGKHTACPTLYFVKRPPTDTIALALGRFGRSFLIKGRNATNFTSLGKSSGLVFGGGPSNHSREPRMTETCCRRRTWAYMSRAQGNSKSSPSRNTR